MLGARRRLLISPEHRIAIPGRGMVRACDAGLQQETMTTQSFVYYNLELESWKNMIVEGVEVESLAPLRRITVTINQLATMLRAKYPVITQAVLDRVRATCRFIDDKYVVIPVMRKNASG